ncbi:MAG: SURF1 family protein [Ramlibacter sp.]|nr:SURF1 family protein [Ramlibacter sp.]
MAAMKWLLAAAAVSGAALTAGLGVWQWGRAQQRLGLQAAVAQRSELPPVDAAALLAAPDPAQLLHRRIVLRGRWKAGHTVYLDNRQMNGRPGFYVVTPLHLAGDNANANAPAILVQRGWVARNFQQRDKLPPVETPAGEVQLRGLLSSSPARLYAFAGGEGGPIRQNLDLAQFRAETRLPLLDLSVQQTGGPSEGLLREWPQPASGAERNLGYAFQWWALSALIAVLYVWFQFIAPRRKQRA